MILGCACENYITSCFFMYLLYKLLILGIWVYKVFLRKRLNLKVRYGKDTWALITGAADGIGKGFAEALAREGFNIILVSRTLEKLQKVESEIKLINKEIKTHIIVYDFAKKKSLEEYKKDFKEVFNKFEISILVNNVGVGTSTFFKNMDIEEIYDHVSVNTIPQTLLTKFFLNRVLNYERKTAIINLSSASANFPMKALSVYTSTKVFNDFLSRSLYEDFKGNIDILSLKPYFVESNLTKMKSNKDGFFIISSEECAEGTLNQLGYEKEAYGHWKHELYGAMIGLFVPHFIINGVMHRRCLKKQERIDEKNKLEKKN